MHQFAAAGANLQPHISVLLCPNEIMMSFNKHRRLH
jgi:hypothetical protein